MKISIHFFFVFQYYVNYCFEKFVAVNNGTMVGGTSSIDLHLLIIYKICFSIIFSGIRVGAL